MSKFDHVPQACISPSPSKKRIRSGFTPGDVDVETGKLRFQTEAQLHRRKYYYEAPKKKDLEPHLIRVPFDPNAVRKVRTFIDTKGMTAKEKKAAKAA